MNKQIYEEAAGWLVESRVGELDSAARARLDAWFRQSPQHIQAYLELSSIWEDGGDPELVKAKSAAFLVGHARAASNVVSLERDGERAQEVVSRSPLVDGGRKRGWFYGVATAALTCALALGIYLYAKAGVYATGTGEHRTISLADGSILDLNSRSRVRIRYSALERDVDLLEGQALFRVAKETARPFTVRSDSTRVRAVGTQFDVSRKASGTTVTVVEGRVSIYSQQAAVDRLVSAGEQVTVTPATVGKPKHIDVAAETAWTQRELVFDSTPLYAVALEFNRYNTRKLVVSDVALRDFHVTGVFSSTDPASLLRFLRAQPGIEVVEADTEIRISSK